MKRILGAAASVLFWVGACGGNSGSGEVPAKGGTSSNESAGAGGQPPTTPAAGDAGDAAGGTPVELEEGGAGAGGAGGAPNPLSDVSGHIQTFLGSPLPGAVVIINGISTLTDAAGAFTVPAVAAPYDLTLIDDEHKIIEVVEGLITPAPVVRLWQFRAAKGSGSVAGKLSGGLGFPLTAGQAGLVTFRGEHSNSLQVELTNPGQAFSLVNVTWEGSATCAGSLTGIFWKKGATGPTDYIGFGQRALTLEDGKALGNVNGSVAATNLAVTDPAEHTVTGSIAVPGAPTKIWSYLGVGLESVPLALAAGPISVVVPDVDQPTSVAISAEYPEGTSSQTYPTSVSAQLNIEVPSPPQLILPFAAAAGVTAETEFTWTKPSAGTISAAIVTMGVWTVVTVTSRNKVKLPDLSAAGVSYAGNELPGTWEIEQFSPATSAEEALQLIDGTSPSYKSAVTTFGAAYRDFQVVD